MTRRQRHGDRHVNLAELEAALLTPAEDGFFDDDEIRDVPEPVRRFFRASIAQGTPLATAARLRIRGYIKLRRWVPFRSTEVLAPHRGFVWAAHAAGVISGSDHYLDGAGRMQWKLGGLITVMQGSGPDVSRSAGGRAGAEAIWVPTSLLPRYGVAWSASDDHHIAASYEIDGIPIDARVEIDADGRVVSQRIDRWGDPDATGRWAWHPFGCDATEHRSSDGVTIPSRGRVGWFHGTERWKTGEFFRYDVTHYELAVGT